MKLYLSSYQLPTPEDLSQLVGKPLDQLKAVCIANAQDYYSPRARSVKNKRAFAAFATTGLQLIECDLRDYKNEKDLKEVLSQYDLLWVLGGNTFCLRYEMQRSGFDRVIAELLREGLVWAGDSAGAIIVGNTLDGVEMGDDPEFAEKIVWDGLKLINEYVLPHADSTEYAAMSAELRMKHKDNPNFIALRDCDALIVDGDTRTIVSREYTAEEAARKLTIN